MLNKNIYKDKIRYHFRGKKKINLSWSLEDKKININKNYCGWTKNNILKEKNINRIIYISASKRYNYLKDLSLKKKRDKDWSYKAEPVLRKKPFLINVNNRNDFIINILNCLKNKDSLYYVKNSIFFLLDKNTGLHKNLNILNFTWLLSTKNKKNLNDNMEQFLFLALKFIYKGFIVHGFKRQCEIRLIDLLNKLKIFLKEKNKSGLHLMFYFINKLKPLIGFRRRRISRNNAKKKDLRFFYKLYYHNWRWQSLILKRLIFNSPFYLKKTRKVSVMDIFKGLISSLESKGPIVKGLISYYKLIGKRTPYAKRKKKKKGKRRKFK